MPRLKSKISYSLGRHKIDNRPKAFESSWDEFIDDLLEIGADPVLGVSIDGSETEDRYEEKKGRLPYVAAEFERNKRNNNNVISRSLLFIDIDKVSSKEIRRVRRTLEDGGYTFFAYSTCGDRHDLKGGVKSRSWRFLIPTDRPMLADEIWPCQHKFIDMLGLTGAKGMDETAFQRARLMFAPHIEAETIDHRAAPASVRRILRHRFDVPDESGSTNWTDEALENASENSQAIAAWCWEMGLEPLSSGRGFAIQCPNHYQHSDNDGTDGSTAIMMPDALHPEVRFACQHDHCRKHNTHQHMLLRLCGVPDQYLPEAHNISKKQIAELLPDLPEEEITHVYEAEVMAALDGPAAGQCTDEDLDDDPVTLFTKRDPIIEGLVNFKSTWYAAGESNIGKSFFVLGQMAAISAGIPFGGRRVVRAHNFYFDAEGGETSLHRKQALQKMYQDDLDWLHIIDLQDKGIDITDARGVKEVCKIIRDAAGDSPVGLIAFDSLNQTVAMRSTAKKPFDENSPTDMGEIVRALKQISETTGGSAGVIHHPAKSSSGQRTARGSGALHGAVDYAFFIEQPDETKPHQINLYHEKARNGIKQSPRGFVLLKCKIDVPQAHADRVDAYLSTAAGPDFSDQLSGWTPKPLEMSPRDETLYLVPVALAPFESPAAEVAREAVKAYGGAGPKNKAEEVMVAQLELLDDRPEGYSPYAIGTAGGNKFTSGNYKKVLEELVRRRVLVHGRNPDTGEVYNQQYRLPTGVNDFDPPELVASDEDLNS